MPSTPLSEEEIIYLDSHLLVLEKRKGLLTQDSGTGKENLEDLGKAYLKEKFQKPGNVFLEAIHRLDKDVSGIVIFARTSKALKRLQKSVRERNFKKTYLALVEGKVEKENERLEHFLLHEDFKAKISSSKQPEAKKAVLSYQVKEKKGQSALLEVDLETGRYHQIRAQLAAIGHPIVGDVKYGSKAKKGSGIALHHSSCSIPHPIGGAPLSFSSSPKF